MLRGLQIINKLRETMLVVFLLLCVCATAIAAETNSYFDEESATTTLNKITLTLATRKLDIREISTAVARLKPLHKRSKKCVSTLVQEIKTVNEAIIKFKMQTSAPAGGDIEYLENKRKGLSKSLQGCRLFQLRSQETLDAFSKLLKKRSKTEFLEKSPSVFTLLNETYLDKLNFKIEKANVYALFHSEHVSKHFHYILMFIFVFSIIAMMLARIIGVKFFSKPNDPGFINAVILKNMFFITFSSLFAALVHMYTSNSAGGNVLIGISEIIVIYTFGLMALEFLNSCLIAFTNYKKEIYSNEDKIKSSMKVLGCIFALFAIIHTAFTHEIIDRNIEDVVNLVFLILLAMGIAWTFLAVTRLFLIMHHKKIEILLFESLLIGLLAAITLATLIGYHELSYFLLTRVALTILVVMLYVPTLKGVIYFSKQVNQPRSTIGRFVRHKVAVRHNKNLPEIMLLSSTAIVSLFIVLVITMLYIWDATFFELKSLLNFFYNGFSVANLVINPSKILTALLLFGVLMFVVRLISGHITHKKENKRDRTTQNEVASIVNYFGFSIALLVALFAAGVDFTSLAIFAGALSVGLGFGLQNIVNNFVSGLIVLIEKPIKPGDMVIIDNTEGFVARIRIRSTQIKTLANEDVIVPNSDIITSKVTNLMFRDRYWRVECKINVAYGADTGLVEKLLLEVAQAHPKIYTKAPYTPRVMLRSFGRNSYKFELWCITEDVSAKNFVHSELNFAISKAFRENGIAFPFPQRDIHIHNDSDKDD